ncbi:10-formyltetrahydrofolate:L-methionyl-tRNA(fMet) N-formyltransferase [Campylobacter iguaniorum]|uniref:methionyl-tRNA formyltransferase n=1 Tax=Campylobacter iguaniorum TaxID=1244531 RepID=UPI0007C9C817|nr:methionyl-tRNA formyltransferase [Campylobacter iguaniorum]ANE36426.1 10-formyltetrahydrofolate:L-methionyl-tRNA(fMet) N-formyltransferase [Campylobacter iguaniorum]
MKKIVFMGTPDYATTILKRLFRSNYEVVGVFTQPDKPVGRKMVLTPPDVKKFMLENGYKTPIFQPLNLKNDEVYTQICSLKPDFIVVAAYGQILPKNILEIAPCINLHASILPKFRGASPIQEAILKNEKFSGVTAMRMGVGLDDGDMLGFSVLDISGFCVSQLFDELSKMAAELTIKTLDKFDEINGVSQFNALSSKCGKIKKENGLINFELSGDEIWTKFRAFHPWPGVFLANGTKITSLEISNLNGNAGEILAISNDGFVVACAKKSIKIKSIQEPGKKELKAKDYINGKRLSVGSKFC